MIRTMIVAALGATGLFAATFPGQAHLATGFGRGGAGSEFRPGIVLEESTRETRGLPDVFVVASRNDHTVFALTSSGKAADLPDLVVFSTKPESRIRESS